MEANPITEDAADDANKDTEKAAPATVDDEEVESEDEAKERLEAKLMMMAMDQKYHGLHCVAYNYIGGMFGSCTALFGKITAECTKQGGDGFSRYEMYIFLVVMISSLITQVIFQNTALKYHDVMLCLPLFMTTWIIIGVLAGSTYFQEFNSFSIFQIIIFLFGIVLAVGGVGYLTYSRMSAPKE